MLKIYDSSSGRYVTVASNRGDKLYTKSINFQSPELPNYDDDSSIITIDEALTSISDEIKKNKEGIAWIYKNGTLGGGGGSGAGVPKFKVTTTNGNIKDNNIIVNSNQTLNLTFSVTGSAAGRRMIITIKDNKGNFYNYNNSAYIVSTSGTTIQIPNITEDIYIEFSGYDQETLSIIEPYTLNIKVAELKITGPDAVEISKSDTTYNLTYDIKTTAGQNTRVILSTTLFNENTYTYISDWFTDSRKITIDLFKVFLNSDPALNLVDLLRGNLIDNMEITAQAIAGDYTSSTSTSIVFTAENEISIDIIPFSSETSTESIYEYLENDNMSFNIKLYFNTNEFYVYYKLYQIDENNVENIVYYKGDINNPTSDDNKLTSTKFYTKNNPINIQYPSGIDVNNDTVYIYVKAWDRVNPAITGERIKKCKIISDTTWVPYNLSLSGKDTDIDGGLNYLYYEFNTKDIGNINISDTWTSSRQYTAAGETDDTITGKIKYYNANNINNGLLLRGGLENTNTFRMASNTHAILLDDNGNPVRPFTNDKSNWFNNAYGWTISLSFKSDIQSKTDNVVFSCASFTNKGEFNEGIYITTEDVNVRFSNANKSIDKWKLTAKITQNTLNHIDIVYKPKEFDNKVKIGELMIYINGVLSAAAIEEYVNFEYTNHYPTISNDIIFGATQNKNVIFNHSDVNFYRILFYKHYLSAYHVTKNMIQGDAEIKLLENGNIDKLTNTILRQKNFFGKDGKCSLINANTYRNECEFAVDLYSTISTNGENPLPIVFIKVDPAFKAVSEERHNESDVAADKTKPESEKRITKPYDADITIIKERSNKPFIMAKNNNQSIITDFTGRGCTIKLQGTSTLGNRSKNYEISFGANQTQEHLVQPFADMLPENSWILKADVMDSGHANNAAIGGFINDYMAKYPTTAQNDNQYPYASEIKATTKGHPVMLFIQFGDNGNKEFMGIYSFNLGRISHYNLGYKKFDGNYKVISERGDTEGKVVEYENHTVKNTTIEFPAYVSSYKSVAIPYTSDLDGISPDDTTAVCYECIANDDIVGSFQQSDADIINEFYNRVYPEVGNANTDKAFECFRKLFVATSNLYACDPEYLCKLAEGKEYLKTRSLYQRNDKGEFLNTSTKEYEAFNSANESLYAKQPLWQPTDPFLSLTKAQNNGNGNDTGLNWEYLSAYFTLAMLFGLVDSLGKNLNIRSFDLKNWYLEFYDMDTGLALTNTGYENVKKDVYLDAFSMSSDKQSVDVKINGYGADGFETKNSRLFNIVRFFTTKEFPNTDSKPTINYRKIWEDIRSTVLRNPDEFINKYYIKQNEFVGEMIFNYDYDIKYINDEIDAIIKKQNDTFGSINFLHGNRINFVRDWFTKHVYFLDGVFDIKCQAPATKETEALFGEAAGSGFYGRFNAGGGIMTNDTFTPNAENVICPYISFSNQNDRINPPSNTGETFKLRANIPLFFIFNNGALNKQRLYVPENVETEVYLNIKSGGQTASFNYEPYLTIFDKFGDLPYVTLQAPNLAMLNELDLSDMTSLSGEMFNISQLVELRKLNMNNTKITGSKKLSVNLVNAKKISYINLQNSDVESLTLPKINGKPGGVIEELYIDNTDITDVDLTDNVMLKSFSASGCDNLQSLTFVNNNALESFGQLPKNIHELTIDGCNSLSEIKLSGMNNLTNETLSLGHNENVKKFEYTAGAKAENIIDKLDLSGCPNIEEINLQNFTGTFITLNVKSKLTLKKVNFTNSNISYIQWYSDDGKNKHTEYTKINDSYEGVLDFSDCVNMDHIDISGQKTIKYLILPKGRTFENDKLGIARCEKLERIIGNFKTNVNKFRNLSSFRFNEVCKYNASDEISHIILDYDKGTLSVDDDVEPKSGPFEDDNKKWYYEIDLTRSLTNYSFIEDGAKIEGSFSGTGINISDLYAILIKLREWKSKEYISEDNSDGYITEFVRTFEGCANIRTGCTGSKYESEKQNIRLDIFTPFKKLLKLDSTFKGCSNINGLITTAHDAPLEHHSNSIFNNKTLNEINNVFNECGNIKISSLVFYYTPSLKIINSPFSSTTEHHINAPDYAISFEYIFKNNEYLEEIKRLFNGTSVKFKYIDYSGVDISDLFKNNPNVKTVQYLLSDKFGILNRYDKYDINFANVFGGVSKHDNDTKALAGAKYPTQLKNLDHAFAIDSPLTDTAFTVNWNNMDYIFYGQECEYNDITKRYENTTLETCACMFDHLATISENDADGYVNWGGDSSVAIFPLNMFNTTHKENDGTEHEVWFTKLNSCEGLFKRSAFKAELKFPGNIFKHCVADNLNLSHLLEDSIMTPIKLVTVDDVDENGNNYACFANCKLGDISSMFKNCFRGIEKKDFIDADYAKGKKLYRYDRGGLHGLIPYKFFKNAGKITNMNNLFEGCCHLGNSVNLTCDSSGNYVSGNGDFKRRSINDFYSVKCPSIDVVREVVSGAKDYSALLDLVEYDSEKGIYVWNAWSYDGTIFDNDYLTTLNSITLDGLSYIEAKHKNIPNYIDFEWKRRDENGSIIKPYDDVIANIKPGYLEFRNDNQRESLRRSSYAGEYIEDVNGVPIYRIHYDGDYDIKNVNYDVSYFEYQQLWNCDSYTYLDNTGVYGNRNYKHNNNENSAATPTKFISNYMVPMDLFRYCAPSCTIDGIFMNVSKFNGADKRSKINDYVYGLIGRIPPRLFSPLTELTKMESVFENCNGIIPYAQSLDGLMYNFSFNDNSNMDTITKFFKGTLILGNLSSVLFDKLTELVDISELCKNGYMPAEYAADKERYIDYVNFIPSEIFKNNTQLSNLSGAFARDNNNNDELIAKSHLYFTLNTNLLTTSIHKNILNVSGMFTNQNRGVQRKETDKTTFIDFRLWGDINNMSMCYSGANFDLLIIPEELGGSKKN